MRNKPSPETEVRVSGSDLKYARFDVSGLESISALIPHWRRGIYVLEFRNGEFYVGQSQNVVTRFAQHRHGHTNHFEAWEDVEKLWFMPVPIGMDLTRIENNEICRFRESGKPLRNRALNLGHDQPSKLDDVIPVENQQSWVLGDGSYDLHGAREKIPDLGNKPSKFLKQVPEEYRDQILADLSFALTNLVSNAVQLEGWHWTISDCPSTAGGRWATLNTGFLEFLYFPKGDPGGFAIVNTSSGSSLATRPILRSTQIVTNCLTPCRFLTRGFLIKKVHYKSTSADQVIFNVGDLTRICEKHPEVLNGARAFALQAMRQSRSAMFARWHSQSLTRDIYQFALGKHAGTESD